MKKFFVPLLITAAVFLVQATFKTNDPVTKAELGRLLFFDPILSKDSTISCGSCHIPAFAFADTAIVSTGVGGKKGTRNAPSSMNLLLPKFFFWDGRAASLEEQALAPIENPDEMDLPVHEAVKRLQNSKKYSHYFNTLFNSEPTSTYLAEAISAFERTLETSDSPFDDWKFSGNEKAVSDAVKRGFKLFNSKGKCAQCHFGADLTFNDFRNVGLFDGKKFNDSGRSVISKKQEDIGKFKISSLRNVALTAPYMHNGMFKTLDQVIDFYNDPTKVVPNSINRDSLLAKPLGLTKTEKADLKAFLMALTDKRFKERKILKK